MIRKSTKKGSGKDIFLLQDVLESLLIQPTSSTITCTLYSAPSSQPPAPREERPWEALQPAAQEEEGGDEVPWGVSSQVLRPRNVQVGEGRISLSPKAGCTTTQHGFKGPSIITGKIIIFITLR